MVEYPKSYEESFEPFKNFCFTYRDEIESILKSRLVQTNEVRRCTYLYPAFCMVYGIAKKPLSLIEIGTSAGLQLLWDQYSYTYGENMIYGNIDSTLILSADIEGIHIPNLHLTPPSVSSRVGLDLNTINLNDRDEKLWLKSLIWPEHKERMHMFEQAAACVRDNSVKLIEGDGLSLLSNCTEDVSGDSVVCIFHTHVANQMSIEAKKQLLQAIDVIGQKRDIFHIYNNMQDRYLHLDYYMDGILKQHMIAETDGHGRWFKWLLENRETVSH